MGFEGFDDDEPLKHGSGGFGLAQLGPEPLVVLEQSLHAVLEEANWFWVTTVPGDACPELILQVLMSMGQNPSFDVSLHGKGLDGQFAVGSDWFPVKESPHRLADRLPLRLDVGHERPSRVS